MELRQQLTATRPKQTWEEFVERMPAGKAPTIKEITDRWSEYEEQTITRNGKTTVVRGVSKDNGEQRAYMAWLLGVMEPDEQQYFAMMTLRNDVLVQAAIVPALRAMAEYVEKSEKWMSEVFARIQTLQASGKVGTP